MKKRAKDKQETLAQLTEEERITYVQRRAALEVKHLELMALSNYLDETIVEIRTKYSLPRFFDVDMQSGAIRRSEVPDGEADSG